MKGRKVESGTLSPEVRQLWRLHANREWIIAPQSASMQTTIRAARLPSDSMYSLVCFKGLFH